MKINIFFISLLFVIIIPGIIAVNLITDTYSVGALISAIFIFLIYIFKRKVFYLDNSFWFILLYLIIIFLFSLYPMLFFEWFELKRFFLSYLMICIYLIASSLFINLSLETTEEGIYKYINIIFYLVLFDGAIFLISKIIDPSSNNPELFFFPEISHFSLIFLPLLLFKVITSKSQIYINSIIITSLMLALFAKSFTLLIGSIMVMFFYSVKKTFIFLIFFIILILILSQFELISGYDFIYFRERIPHFDTNNVSVLVFFSGWERAYLNLSNNGLFGIGFNQLGNEVQNSFFQNKLSTFGLESLNLKDGGSVAPKLISELGILGLISLVVYIFYFIKITLKLKRYMFNYSNLEIFYISIFLMSFLNLFARGSGYFSPIMFLFLSSIFYFLKFDFNNHSVFSKRGIEK